MHKSDNYISVIQALVGQPISLSAMNQEYTNHQVKVIEMLRHIPPGESAWYDEICSHLSLNVKETNISQKYASEFPYNSVEAQ